MENAENVVLVTVDCLRPDHLPTYGYNRETAPFIDEIAEDSIVFENAFATGPGTSVSFPSILSGRYPFDYNGYNGISSQESPLAELLNNNNINTAGIHSNTFLTEHYGYSRGFNLFESFTEESSKEGIGANIQQAIPDDLFDILQNIVWKYRSLSGKNISLPYTPADQTTNKAIQLLQKLDEPFFLWVHYLDPHEPYRPPAEIFNSFSATAPNWQSLNNDWKKAKKYDNTPDAERLNQFIDAYDSEIRFVDQNIRRLWSALSEQNLDDRTMKILTADHGEEFLDHGGVSHTPKLYDELIHVPLIIDTPDNIEYVVEEQIVSLIDLPSTILRSFNLEQPQSYRGYPLQNLINKGEIRREYIIAEVCHEWGEGVEAGEFDKEKMIITTRSDDYKYIKDNQKGVEEFYNIAEDPGEQFENENIPESEKENLRMKVNEHLSDLHEATSNQSSKQTPDNVQDRMRDLGYIE